MSYNTNVTNGVFVVFKSVTLGQSGQSEYQDQVTRPIAYPASSPVYLCSRVRRITQQEL